MSLNLQEWGSKLIGKTIIPIGGQVTNPAKEFSEEDVRARSPGYRILKPGSMVTMDYRENRINIYVGDASNVVERVTIG